MKKHTGFSCVKSYVTRALFLITFSLFLSNGFAKLRSPLEALGVVHSFCQKEQSPLARSISDNTAITLAYTCKDSVHSTLSKEKACYYVFNMGEDNGFVIVSGDDRAKDILGYSDRGSFTVDDMPENFRSWMRYYESELKTLAALPEDTTAHPSHMAVTTKVLAVNSNSFATAIRPLLGAIAWDQGKPYNILCPMIEGEQALTGCVATAMAQVMRYHQWPVSGTGSRGYKLPQVTDSLSVDFSRATYDWANMKDTYYGNSTKTQDSAVATLMYHCGISVGMDYTPWGSSAISMKIPGALVANFGYDENCQGYSRNFYTEAEWISMLKADLNDSLPVLYGGGKLYAEGHQFVCDGYDTDNLFHFNWGWGGNSNGYFELSSLNPYTPGVGGTTGGYSLGQEMITGIQKPTDTTTKKYQIVLYGALQATKEKIARDSLFAITYGFANIGGDTFGGDLALALYQGDSLVSILKKETLDSFLSFTGDMHARMDSLTIDSTLADGSYQLYSIFKAKGESSWHKMRYIVGNPNSLDVTITPAEVRFSTPDLHPVLTLVEPIKVLGAMYQGETTRLSATIKNTGSEYNAYLTFQLVGENSSQNLRTDPVNIPAGATRTIEMKGTVRMDPGDYLLNLRYDSCNNGDTLSMELLAPVANNTVHVTVQNAPTLAPQLILTEKVTLTDSILAKGSETVLTAKVKNIGGYFNNTLVGFIFFSSGGYAGSYIGPLSLLLEANEEKVVTLNTQIKLDEGAYTLVLLYYDRSLPGGSAALTPDSYGSFNFTVVSPTDMEEGAVGKLHIYPNPATDVLTVDSPTLIKSIQVLDLSGKEMLQMEPMTSGTVPVRISSLSKGAYIIQIETKEGTTTEKFFKK